MISKFFNFFGENKPFKFSGDLYRDIITQLGGKQFGNGLFNIFTRKDAVIMKSYVAHEFYRIRRRFEFELFAYDWMGRCYGILEEGEDKGRVLAFDPDEEEIFDLECDLEYFLNYVLRENEDILLWPEEYEQWLDFSHQRVEYGKCAGYKKLLFTGGKDEITNREYSDLRVYWYVIAEVSKRLDEKEKQNTNA